MEEDNLQGGLKVKCVLLDSIPGLDDWTTAVLLVCYNDLQRFGATTPAVAFAELDPTHHESGSSAHVHIVQAIRSVPSHGLTQMTASSVMILATSSDTKKTAAHVDRRFACKRDVA